jgi:hypothetical protein
MKGLPLLQRFAILVFLIRSLGTLPAAASVADDTANVTGVVQKFFAAFGTGDTKTMASLGAPSNQAVIDEFAPHYWNGPNALLNWYRSFQTMERQFAVTEPKGMVSAPTFVSIDGPRAYASYPMGYTYKDHGKPAHESGYMTVALEKVPSGWRILGWTWARLK